MSGALVLNGEVVRGQMREGYAGLGAESNVARDPEVARPVGARPESVYSL